MDLRTTYMGMTLRNPLVVSACGPLSEDIGNIKRAEDAGAGAVVLYSLFEEQLHLESRELDHYLTQGTDSFAEALSYFPEPEQFHLGPEGYLNHIHSAKQAVGIPIIASLNGTTAGGWTKFAKEIERRGGRANVCGHCQGGQGRGRDPRCGEIEPIFQQYGEHGEASRRCGRGRARAVQSILPTRHRP